MAHQQEEEEEVPWLDLLEDLTENILQRLPLSDYIRFAAVCRRWHTIQSNHRQRFFPSPPPLLSLPWFISFDPSINHLTSALCMSPWESIHNRRNLLSRPPTTATKHYAASSPHGWLLLFDLESFTPPSIHFSLFNPISATDIPLPPIRAIPPSSFSFPPIISPPPNYTVYIITKELILFFVQPGNAVWSQIQLPSFPCSAIPSNNLLYYISSDWDLFSVDTDSAQIIEMDKTQIDEAQPQQRHDAVLVESNGEVMIVASVFDEEEESYVRNLKKFEVFKAELAKKMWVKMEEGLGERVIVMDGGSSVSLRGEGVGNGVKGNCIYFFWNSGRIDRGERSQWNVFDFGSQWKVFDFRSGQVNDVENPTQFTRRMFVPSLC